MADTAADWILRTIRVWAAVFLNTEFTERTEKKGAETQKVCAARRVGALDAMN